MPVPTASLRDSRLLPTAEYAELVGMQQLHGPDTSPRTLWRFVHTEEVTGSNPVSPTPKPLGIQGIFSCARRPCTNPCHYGRPPGLPRALPAQFSRIWLNRALPAWPRPRAARVGGAFTRQWAESRCNCPPTKPRCPRSAAGRRSGQSAQTPPPRPPESALAGAQSQPSSTPARPPVLHTPGSPGLKGVSLQVNDNSIALVYLDLCTPSSSTGALTCREQIMTRVASEQSVGSIRSLAGWGVTGTIRITGSNLPTEQFAAGTPTSATRTCISTTPP